MKVRRLRDNPKQSNCCTRVAFARIPTGRTLAAIALVWSVWLGAGTQARAKQNVWLSGLKAVPPTVQGECKMVPDSAHGGLTNSKQVPAALRGVNIVQRLNQQVPLDLTFKDAFGKTVRLSKYFGSKPVILSLVYLNCPMLCPMEENGLLTVLRTLKFNLGQQYNVVTVSFDPHDTPEMARDKQQMFMDMYARPGVRKGWYFLTGSEASIHALTQAVGFHYRYDPETHQFYHAVAIAVLTPQGRISRYFFGIEYPEESLRLALVQASDGKVGTPVDAFILYCCRYNPRTGKYGLVISHVLMMGGVLTILTIGGLVFLLLRNEHRTDHVPA